MVKDEVEQAGSTRLAPCSIYIKRAYSPRQTQTYKRVIKAQHRAATRSKAQREKRRGLRSKAQPQNTATRKKEKTRERDGARRREEREREME